MSGLVGRKFGSYEIMRELGKGGMAVVYLGRQTSMDRSVAIKVISTAFSDDPDFRRRFDQEAHTIARLQHPHILPVIDYGEEDFGAYLVMRYVDGGTLEDRLIDGPLPLPQASAMLDRIAAALDHAHVQGVIHRDLKPANILLDGNDNPYLTDFGIARLLQSTQRLTATGATVGTPAYMAPEQWKSEDVGPFTDQYALGVVLYEMVTGDLPFKADTTFGYMHKHVYELPEPPTLTMADLPPSAEAVILQALAKTPADRFSSVTVLSSAFASGVTTGSGQMPAVTDEVIGLYEEPTAMFQTPPPPPFVAVDDLAEDDVTQFTPPPASPTKQAAAPDRQPASRRGVLITALVAVVTVLVLGGLLAVQLGLLGGVSPTATPSATDRMMVAAAPTETAPPPTATAGVEETSVAVLIASDTPAPTDAPTMTQTPRPPATATLTRTPDQTATGEAALVGTAQNLQRSFTATAIAAVFAQATDQAERTGTAAAIASFTKTATVTPTDTPTLTATSTATSTSTPLPTSTPAPTLTPTWTPFVRVTIEVPTLALATATPRPTDLPKVTATLDPVERPVSCPGLLPSLLLPGDIARVSDEDPRPLNVRAEPSLTGERLTRFEILTEFEVLEGPVCADGYPWYLVQAVNSGWSGWIAESGTGVYFVELVERGGGSSPVASCPGVMPFRLEVGMIAVVDTPTNLPLLLHIEPGASAEISASLANERRVYVLDGPVCRGRYSWWQVRSSDGRFGWASEADNDSYFITPAS